MAQLIHDLKNPLSVILCYADIVPDAKECDRREFCGRLQANARALIEILNGFALLSDLRCGRVELSCQAFDWVKLVMTTVADLEEVARSRNQRLACEAAGGHMVWADRQRLELGLRHLLLESLRLAPGGATVKVRVAAEDAAAAEIVVPDDPRSSPSPKSGRVEALLAKKRPAIELVQRIVALHGGSVSFAAGEGDLVAAIELPAG